MTDLQWIPVDAQTVAPWKNGGGTTREVAVARRDGHEPFDWRVSIAEVATDGPFSEFPGVDRTLWVLEGAGVHLDVDGVAHALDARLEAFRFRGEARVRARLIDGPIRDLNLMVARDRVRASASIVTVAPGATMRLPAHGSNERLVVALRGAGVVDEAGVPAAFGTGDALRWAGDRLEAVSVTAQDRLDLLWLRIVRIAR